MNMDNSSYFYISVILAEIMLILFVLLYVLYKKYKFYKKRVIQSGLDSAGGDTFLQKLDEMISSAEQKMMHSNDENKRILLQRIKFLRIEKKLVQKSINTDMYWKNILQEYADFVVSEVPNEKGSNADAKHSEYLSQIHGISEYKKLLISMKSRLLDSYEKIDELRRLADGKSSPDMESILEKIDIIEKEKNAIQEDLDKAGDEFEKIFSNVEYLEQLNKDATHQSEFEAMKEENDFLAKQIEFLLKQEVEETEKQFARIEYLEASLEDKTQECKKLQAQLAK